MASIVSATSSFDRMKRFECMTIVPVDCDCRHCLITKTYRKFKIRRQKHGKWLIVTSCPALFKDSKNF